MTGTCEPCKGTGYWYVTNYPNAPYPCQRCQATGTPVLGGAYAGIGSRETPIAVTAQMELLASTLGSKGWILRSGQAPRKYDSPKDMDSADLAFERGCKAVNGRKIIRIRGGSDKVFEHASQFHPVWSSLSETAQSLHARNSVIMMGDLLDDPVRFVICWTPNGAEIGGTGQALRIAAHHHIPVFNLAIEGHLAALWNWIAQ